MRKISKKNGYLYLFLFCTIWLQAQPDKALQDFEQARKSVSLLVNDLQIIPLKNLATTPVAYLDLGVTGQDGSSYGEWLAKYTRVDQLVLPIAQQSQWLNNILAQYKVVIVGIPENHNLPAALLQQLTDSPAAVFSVFYQSSTPPDKQILPGASTLLTLPDAPWAASVASQIIFGGIGAQGAGLTTEALDRFAYAPPAALGMNAQLLTDSIRSIVEAGIAAGAYPGAQVLVAKNGTVVYHETFGHHTYDKQVPVRQTDLYDFASVTKISSGLPALMKLYGEGKFDLDARLDQYYPDFKGSNKGHLSFRSLLSHNAGLMAWIPFWQGTLKGNARFPWKKRWDGKRINDYRFRNHTFRRDSTSAYTVKVAPDLWLHKNYRQKMFEAIRKSPLNQKPGYVYSDLSFYLLPDIVTHLTGTSDFETYLKDELYHKLGAYTVTYNPTRFFPLQQIIPTERDTFFSLQQIQGRVHDEGAAMLGGLSGHAGLFATTTDLAKLMQLYLNKGKFGEEQIIAPEAIETFITCHYCPEGNFRGLGFDKPLIKYDPLLSSVAKDASPKSFGHSGYTGTFTWADPDSGILLVFMSNRVYPTRANRKLYELNIRPRIHQAIYDAAK